jgi:uncharacterized membrane protein
MPVVQYLLHLWAVPPTRLSLACPAPPAGQTANPVGYFDDVSVHAAFQLTAAYSIVAVLLVIGICYMATNRSTGPSFDRRWLLFLGISALVCGLGAFGLLSTAHTTAMAQSCETNPEAFAVALPLGLVIARSVAGLLWGALAFVLGSVALTRTAGRAPMMWNGFFHNRGTPWPRLTPFGK